MKEFALIVAAGKGTRMDSAMPKQFLQLCGEPVLVHAIRAFQSYSAELTVVVVLPGDAFSTWEALVASFEIAPVILAAGGATRFQSVKAGLEKIHGPGLVAVHDGARPLVSREIIRESFRLAALHGSAVASVPLKDSIRAVDGLSSAAADRSRFRLVQTPQTFDVEMLRRAYAMPEDSTLTDDASVAERAGHAVFLFEGSDENIKITTPADLAAAGAMMKGR